MSPTELLQNDHEVILSLYEEFKSARDSKKNEIAKKILQEFEIHAQVEEEIFYPALEREGDDTERTMVAKSLAEHKSVKNMIEELEGMEAGDQEFEIKMETLVADVAAHAQAEETELFPKMEELLGKREFEALGAEIGERKKELKDYSKKSSQENELTEE